jgi:hypothetical protein
MMDEDLADWGEPPTFEEEDHIPALRLRWEGASPEQLGFMRRVYERQIRRAQRQRPFVGDVPEDELDVIEGGHKARTEAAADCRALLAAARAALDQDKRAGLPRAQAVESIRLVSAYRSASHQFLNWQRNFPRYYRRTHEHRVSMAGGEHGEAAADYLARYVGKRLAAPGYSRHNDGARSISVLEKAGKTWGRTRARPASAGGGGRGCSSG